ncbi:hypothetical protein [uncultured Microbacterium sp.]|uniref:hypothetical protein n=1 Tax=uncultured Microbacterium sp. TaxID=191216 RepID=UPI0026240011|nr:hypothetical protein [uncultured Microbacterium sp.]
MNDVTLVPALYRCPDHDQQETVTERVRDLVQTERAIRADLPSAPFRVTVTCPGHPADPTTAHRRSYDGTWTAEVPARV